MNALDSADMSTNTPIWNPVGQAAGPRPGTGEQLCDLPDLPGGDHAKERSGVVRHNEAKGQAEVKAEELQ